MDCYLVINELVDGTNPETIGELIASHRDWVREKIEAGVIIQAGKWGERQGAAFLWAENVDAAKDIIDEDPFHRSGHFKATIAQYFPVVENATFTR